jgi:TonB family protein
MAAICLSAGLGLCGTGCSHKDSIPGDPGVSITPGSAMLRPGEKLRFQTVIRADSWEVVEGYEHGVVSPAGEYQAPYFAPDNPTTTVRANTLLGHADAPVTLLPGEADTAGCFGARQDHLPAPGEYVFVEELPEAIYRRLPVYPELARMEGVQGVVMVMALVCVSGQVIETSVIKSIPLLDDAAQQAVRHWIFLPAKAGGEPVAVWVGVPVQFSLH